MKPFLFLVLLSVLVLVTAGSAKAGTYTQTGEFTNMTNMIFNFHLNNELSNATGAYDSSFNTFVAYTNATWNTTSKAFGGASLTFLNGVGDTNPKYMKVPENNTFDAITQGYFSAWVMPENTASAAQTIFRRENSSGRYTIFRKQAANGKLEFLSSGNGTAISCTTDVAVLLDKGWMQVGFSFNTTQVDIIVNGAVNKTCYDKWVFTVGTSNCIAIGDANCDNSAEAWNSNIDEVAFFNKSVDNLFAGEWTGPATPYIFFASPKNTTYYNNFSISLSVSNVSFDYSTWVYSFGSSSNVSFNGNTTISYYQYGAFCVQVMANSTTNAWYSNTSCFTNDVPPKNMITVCNSSTVGLMTCLADGFSSVPCRQMSFNFYAWDTDNITYCPDGCFNGTCLVISKRCQDKCIVNDTICYDDYNYITCGYNNASGCYDWSEQVRCKNGCFGGRCAQELNKCQPYTMKCQDSKAIVWCLDENHDSIYEWSQVNRTVCDFQCVENFSQSKVNAYCTAHSLTDEAYAIRNIVNYYVNGMRYGAEDNPRILLMFSLMISIIVGIGIGYLGRSVIAGVIGTFISICAFTAVTWFPWPLTLVMLIIGGFIIMKGVGNDG